MSSDCTELEAAELTTPAAIGAAVAPTDAAADAEAPVVDTV